MTALAWQTMLLLGLAYLLGCWLACLLRRMMGSAQDNQVTTPAVAGAVPASAATAVARLAVPAAVPLPTARVPAPAVSTAAVAPVRDAFRRADTLEPVAAAAGTMPPASGQAPVQSPASAEATVARFERALTATPAPSTPSVSAANAAVAAAAAAAAAATATAAAVRAGSAQVAQPVVRVQAPSMPVAAAPLEASAGDDLKRIRTIDQGLEAALRRAGIRRYADIAGWKPQDVARISAELGFKGRIEQENWIEQAQILARGEETHYSSRMARGELAKAKPVEDEGERARPPVVQPSPVATAPAAPVPAPAKVEAPLPAPVKAPVVAANAAPPAQNPQRTDVVAAASAAAALAAAAAAAAAAAKVAAPAADVAPKAAVAAPAVAITAPDVSGHAAFAERGAEAANAPAAVPAAAPATAAVAASAAPRAIGSSRDSLQRIGGITPEIEKLLNVQGVTRYSQIAQWGKTDIERFDRLLGYQGRIQRENWIEQAQILARGGDTTYSREHDRRMAVASASPATAAPAMPAPATTAPAAATAATLAAAATAAASAVAAAATATAAATASGAETGAQAAVQAARPSRLADAIRGNEARPGNDLSSLRSVRSEGMRGGVAAPGPGARSAEQHDLKRIRGIGVLIEKKLNSMGISRYEQIAEWQTADIERVSQALDFKGRIERENWVEQARILASGGQTEFSRRADRGDMGSPS